MIIIYRPLSKSSFLAGVTETFFLLKIERFHRLLSSTKQLSVSWRRRWLETGSRRGGGGGGDGGRAGKEKKKEKKQHKVAVVNDPNE